MTWNRLMAVLLFIWLLPSVGKSQTVVLTQPVADKQGMIAFRITEIIRVEGNWDKPLKVDQLVYPLRPAKAHPLARFGESVLMVFNKPGELTQWQGLNIHNGCIPALNGRSFGDLLTEISKLPTPTSPNPGDKGESVGSGASQQLGEAQYAVCPICKQRHIRIK